MISERSETKLWMELTFAAQRSRVDLVQRRKVYIYISFFPFFRLDTRELKLYQKNWKLQETKIYRLKNRILISVQNE